MGSGLQGNGAGWKAAPRLRGAKAKRDQQHPSPSPSRLHRAVPATRPQPESLGEIPSGFCPNVNPDQGLTFYITLKQHTSFLLCLF